MQEPPCRRNVILPWQAWLTPNGGEKLRGLAPEGPFSLVAMNLQNVASSPAQEEPASAGVAQDNSRIVETSIPARLDNLSWSGFHTRVVVALGITWILDGLEVTLAGALSGAVKEVRRLHSSISDSGLATTPILPAACPAGLASGCL